MSNCQDNRPTFLPEAVWKALMNLPALRYMKAPVDTVAQLYEKYPIGNEKGTFAFVHNDNTFYTYHPRGWHRGEWKPIAGGMESFFEIDAEFLKEGDILVYDSNKKKFVVKSGNVWNKLIGDLKDTFSQVTKFLNQTDEVPTDESDSGVYFVHKDENDIEFRALYIVLGKKSIKIFNSSDYRTKDYVDTELAKKANQTQVDDIAASVDVLAVTKADKSVVDALQNGIIKQPAVDTYNDTSGGKTSLLNKYPNPQVGWDVLVREENTRYNWNGSVWVNMESGVYDDTVAKKEDLNELERRIDQYKANIFDKNNIRFGKIINTTTKNIVDANASMTSAVFSFALVPDWATKIYAYSHEGDALPANLVVRFSKEPTDTSDALLLTLSDSETIGKLIPDEYKDYKYVAATIVRNSTAGFVPDLDNIFIGFSSNYKTDELAKDIIPAPDKDEDFRFESLDFNCFEVFETDRSDVVTSYSDLKASQIYRAFISLELRGFDLSKKYKLSMVRRNYGGDERQDYSIIIGSFDGTAWIRDAYFISTGNNIESSNPGGINIFENTLADGRSIKAVIDYSYIPVGYSVFVDRTENAEPHFVIKNECFYAVDPNYALNSEALKNDDLTLEEGSNIAYPSFIIEDKYINTTGGISSGAGWKMIGLPVTEGDVITFGRFSIATSGYSAYYNDAGALILYNGGYTDATLPKTVTAPEGATILYIVIKRPTNSDSDYAQLTINRGSILLPYESPTREVSEIKGYGLKAENPILEQTVQELVDEVTGMDERISQLEIGTGITPFLSSTYGIMELPAISEGQIIKEGYAFIDDTNVNDKIFKLK